LSLFTKGKSGNPKGRPKGRKDYATDIFEAAAACRKLGVNPFEVLAEIALNEKKTKSRILACAHLMKYLAPQLRSIDLTSNGKSIVNMIFDLGKGELNAEPPGQ
jgi:Family of unknown function (DUF5681)